MSHTTRISTQAAAPPPSLRPDRTRRPELCMRDIMSQEMVTATSDETIFEAARRMSGRRVSCVIVVENETVIGILTDKDILKGVAETDRQFDRQRVGERMSSPVEVISPNVSVITAGQIMHAKGIRRLPVVEAGRLVGVVTQTDITRGLISISPLKAVCEIMTTDVATVDTAASVAQAAQGMAAKGISCLIATHRGGIAGIVTEKDVLRRAVALRRDPLQTQVVDVMSFPVTTVTRHCSVLSAGLKMEHLRLHRLVVMDDEEVCGIVTQTDIAAAVRAELERLQHEHEAARAQLRHIVRHVMQDMASLQTYLNTLPAADAMDAAR